MKNVTQLKVKDMTYKSMDLKKIHYISRIFYKKQFQLASQTPKNISNKK